MPFAPERDAVAFDEELDLLVADVEPLLELDFAVLLPEDAALDAPAREVDFVDLEAEPEPRPPEADFVFALLLPEARDLLPPDDFEPVLFFAEDPVDEDLLDERDEADFEADDDFVFDFEPDDFAPPDLDPDDFDDADFRVEDFFVVAIMFPPLNPNFLENERVSASNMPNVLKGVLGNFQDEVRADSIRLRFAERAPVARRSSGWYRFPGLQ